MSVGHIYTHTYTRTYLWRLLVLCDHCCHAVALDVQLYSMQWHWMYSSMPRVIHLSCRRLMICPSALPFLFHAAAAARIHACTTLLHTHACPPFLQNDTDRLHAV